MEKTEDQKKAIRKLWRRFLFETFFIGGHHGLMLFFVNFIIVMFLNIVDWPSELLFPFGLVAAFFVLRRMDSELKTSRDRMDEKVKEILDQK